MSRRELVRVDGRSVHVVVHPRPGRRAVTADERPVVLLHQTPRSHDEFRDVGPLLAAAGRTAYAVDTPGFGASDPPPRDAVESWADVVSHALDRLGVREHDVVGHHTGGVLGVELAAREPDRVGVLVLSSTPYADDAWRAKPPHGVDVVEPQPDGSHLTALWQGRQRFYPDGRPDLLERFVRDALAAGQERTESGHRVVREYDMPSRLARVRAHVGLVSCTGDPFAQPHLPRWTERYPDAPVAAVDAGVPAPDEAPRPFARAVLDLLDRLDAAASARLAAAYRDALADADGPWAAAPAGAPGQVA